MAHGSKVSPILHEISESLTQLLGKDVSVTPLATHREPTDVLVRYVDGAAALISAWTLDRPLAWALGGALTMIPAEIVEEAVTSGAPQQELEDNFREVVNVLATIPSNVLQRRAVLESVTTDLSNLQRTARQMSCSDASWILLRVTVAGYTEGNLAVSMVPTAK